jgi:hypothetical protein
MMAAFDGMIDASKAKTGLCLLSYFQRKREGADHTVFLHGQNPVG